LTDGKSTDSASIIERTSFQPAGAGEVIGIPSAFASGQALRLRRDSRFAPSRLAQDDRAEVDGLERDPRKLRFM